MLLPGHDTAMMICLIPPLRRRASGDGKVSRKNVSDVAKAPLRCSPGDGAKSHLSSWWTSHTYPLTDRVKPEERRRRGAPIDLDVSLCIKGGGVRKMLQTAKTLLAKLLLDILSGAMFNHECATFRPYGPFMAILGPKIAIFGNRRP